MPVGKPRSHEESIFRVELPTIAQVAESTDVVENPGRRVWKGAHRIPVRVVNEQLERNRNGDLVGKQ